MDVGGDIGGLILYTPAAMDGREIEISRDGQPGARRTHAEVRARQLPAGTRYAAVYPGLPAGAYTIWDEQDRPAARVTITGGEVATCGWDASCFQMTRNFRPTPARRLRPGRGSPRTPP
jgi:hypothetical protein